MPQQGAAEELKDSANEVSLISILDELESCKAIDSRILSDKKIEIVNQFECDRCKLVKYTLTPIRESASDEFVVYSLKHRN